jgi:cytosolic carboxypeptidase protein 2/3
MKGLLTYLLSDTQEAKLLRSHFIFYIIPMLNPDGVKYGNYRCSLLGVDLNRKWIAPNRFLQPTIFYAKQLVRMISEEREILMYCDLHGHSRKQNVFMYGCSHKNTQYEHIRKNANIRLIPLLLSQKNPNFSYRDSKFKLEKCKESTARIVLFKEFNISNSYTCEATFFG